MIYNVQHKFVFVFYFSNVTSFLLEGRSKMRKFELMLSPDCVLGFCFFLYLFVLVPSCFNANAPQD